MDRTKILEAITDALGEVLQRELLEISPETRLFEDLHLDSTSILSLLMALEDRTGVEVDPETLEMDTFRTIETLAAYVESNVDVTVS
ncbi:MAG TPA: acyl carrier protein [Amycolatopsis sp.]|nr:acyl carrier protein [Amycolatopsis sp.]